MTDGDPAMKLSTPPPHVILQTKLCGMMLTQCIRIAAELGIADLLNEGSLRLEVLAAKTKTHPQSLHRVLRALVSSDIFEESEETFSQTPQSALLRSDISGSMRDIARMHGDEWQWHPWEQIEYSVRTGLPAFDQLYNMSMWEYFRDKNPRSGAIFDNAMAAFSSQINDALAKAYDFSYIGTLVDVGGGTGSFLHKILSINPFMKGILFDRPQVIEKVQAGGTLNDRCDFVGGDFFHFVPQGADAYFMKQIIKDWDDLNAQKILTMCRRAIQPGGKVLITEVVIPEEKGMLTQKLTDVQLMVVLNGRERTETEFRELFRSAGLSLERIIPTESPYSILECIS